MTPNETPLGERPASKMSVREKFALEIMEAFMHRDDMFDCDTDFKGWAHDAVLAADHLIAELEKPKK